jgi:LAGLIDADG endonuclease
MLSNNHSSADNQQESQSLNFESWITGFVDGGGTFAISIFKNQTLSLGYQVMPEFVITQGAKSLTVLESIKAFFKCGQIFVNRRKDNHTENIYRYCVRDFVSLDSIIVPFFKKFPLQTAKQNDFGKFVQVLELIKQKQHLSESGLNSILTITNSMNRKKL